MTINFNLFNSFDDVDYSLDGYTDEELMKYLELDSEFTQMDLMQKIIPYNKLVDNYPNHEKQAIYRYFFNNIKTRLELYLSKQDDSSDNEEIKYKIKQPNKIQKRHTLVINSDKRANRSDPTTSFEWELADEISNVKSLYIESYNIPKTWYNLSNDIGNNIFGINYLQPLKFFFTTETGNIESKFLAKSPYDSIYNNNYESEYKNWFNENIVTQDIGAGLIRDHNGRPYTQFPDMWDNVTWNVLLDDVSTNRFTINYTGSGTRNFDISYREFPTSTFDYVLIRDVSNADIKIQESDFLEDTSRNIYFLIKRNTLEQQSESGNKDSVIAEFLNRRTPYNFRAIEEDPRAVANFQTETLLNYEELLSQFEGEREDYEPPNIKKNDDYDLWSSYKRIDYNGSENLTITTSMLKTEAKEVLRDISNVSWTITNQGIAKKIDCVIGSTTILPSEYYNLPTARFVDVNTIEVTVTPKLSAPTSKSYSRNVFFSLPEGNYGNANEVKNALNALQPKLYYDKYLNNNGNQPSDYLTRVIDTVVDLSNVNYKTHQMIRDAYSNDYGTSFFNTIEWNFIVESSTSKFNLQSITPGVTLILYNNVMDQIFEGNIGCVTNRNKGYFSKRNTLGRMMGYYTDTNPDTDFVITSESDNNLASNIPDLRRIRSINIMLIDYKSYAFAANANQNIPAPTQKKLKTPWYYYQVEFETVCQQNDDGTITEAQVPVYTGENARQLTENQIYSTNAILESQQQEKTEKTLNYVYRDYYLYGIDVKDKPQPGGREGSEGVLATYDSKKGKREYNEPTRLTKFRLELTDQDYNLLDLNGIDIELTLNIDTETMIE